MAAIAGLAVLVVVAAIGAVWVTQRSVSDSASEQPSSGAGAGPAPTSPAGAPPASVTPTAGVPSTTPPDAQPTSTPTPSVGPLTPSPSAYFPTPYWTVIVGSATDTQGGRAAAEAVAGQLVDVGYGPDIFYSDYYSSLNPGYWVTATGHLDTHDEASLMSVDLQALGLDVAYPKCIGTTAECA